MIDSATPATQALLPVTPEDETFAQLLANNGPRILRGIHREELVQLLARHRQTPSLPGDVGTLLDCIRREGLWGHPGLHAAVQAVAALTPSAPAVPFGDVHEDMTDDAAEAYRAKYTPSVLSGDVEK